MQRRDFVRTALFGTGAACSLALPSAYAACSSDMRNPLHMRLARASTRDGFAQWRSIERCGSEVCAAPQSVRITVDALAFPVDFGALSIEAMFATNAGLRPFRIAGHQPGSLSPSSKPFSFEADSAALAGFRAEHVEASTGSSGVCASALLGAARPVLAVGRYLLVVSNVSDSPDIESLPVPSHAAESIVTGHGGDAHFAWLAFSVQPLTG